MHLLYLFTDNGCIWLEGWVKIFQQAKEGLIKKTFYSFLSSNNSHAQYVKAKCTSVSCYWIALCEWEMLKYKVNQVSLTWTYNGSSSLGTLAPVTNILYYFSCVRRTSSCLSVYYKTAARHFLMICTALHLRGNIACNHIYILLLFWKSFTHDLRLFLFLQID